MKNSGLAAFPIMKLIYAIIAVTCLSLAATWFDIKCLSHKKEVMLGDVVICPRIESGDTTVYKNTTGLVLVEPISDGMVRFTFDTDIDAWKYDAVMVEANGNPIVFDAIEAGREDRGRRNVLVCSCYCDAVPVKAHYRFYAVY